MGDIDAKSIYTQKSEEKKATCLFVVRGKKTVT